MWRLKKTIKYIIIVTLTFANFEVYIAYSNEEQYHISSTFEGTMLTITFFMATFWLAMYNSVLINTRTVRVTFAAILARFLSSCLMGELVKTG